MKIIHDTKIEEIENGYSISIPVLNDPEGIIGVKFLWKKDDDMDSFLARISPEDVCVVETSRKFYLAVDYQDEYQVDLEMFVYDVVDDLGCLWFLVCMREPIERYDLTHSFCVRRHHWNLYQIYREFIPLLKMEPEE